MACGVPVVQPRHGSFPELIEATGGGHLFEPGNREALANAIAELKNDDALRARLARDGRAAVREKFTDAIMAERTWEVFMRYSGGTGAPKTRSPIR
jgi:glycosyltransferase involved in cell wall biosynthesis